MGANGVGIHVLMVILYATYTTNIFEEGTKVATEKTAMENDIASKYSLILHGLYN